MTKRPTKAVKEYMEQNHTLPIAQLAKDTGMSKEWVQEYLFTAKEAAKKKERRGNEIVDSRTGKVAGAIMTKALSEKGDSARARPKQMNTASYIHKMD